ncbi:MAG TPA: hypothetical protein VJ625_16090 [Propionibacteriaceae bacterium]|nr:hypothetical protein [Propionibacteriaceae bacterium]
MIIDIAAQIGATSRKVEQQHTGVGEVVAVTLQRSYEAANSPEAQEFNVVSIKEWVVPLKPQELPIRIRFQQLIR